MATNTSHYNLVKPAANENYDVSVLNGNMEKIDTAIWNLPGTYKRSLQNTDDLNNIADGVYYITNVLPSNSPGSDVQYSLLMQVSSSIIKHQYIIKPVSGGIWVREYSGNPAAWQSWKKTPSVERISTTVTTGATGNIATPYTNDGKTLVYGVHVNGKDYYGDVFVASSNNSFYIKVRKASTMEVVASESIELRYFVQKI